MKFFVFLEKWIYFQNKNILFRYKNLLNDLFHNIFWLQKVYQKCITKVKKEPEPPYFRGIRAKIVLLKLKIHQSISCNFLFLQSTFLHYFSSIFLFLSFRFIINIIITSQTNTVFLFFVFFNFYPIIEKFSIYNFKD